jgi:hypothetical protein
MKSKAINLVLCLACWCTAFGLIGQIWSVKEAEAQVEEGSRLGSALDPAFELSCYPELKGIPGARTSEYTTCAFTWLKKHDNELLQLYVHYCNQERTSDRLWCKFVIQLFDLDAMRRACCHKVREGNGTPLAINTTPSPRATSTAAAGQNSSGITRAKQTVTPTPIS